MTSNAKFRSSQTRRQLLQGVSALAAGVVIWKLSPLGARAADPASGTIVGATNAVAQEGAPLVTHTDAEWRHVLTPAQYDVLRQEGTEMPFSSPLNHFYSKGRYDCAGCDEPVFASDTKFDSGTGWPSFWRPLPAAVVERQDGSMGMQRTEIHCVRCAGHLGHVFSDGPPPTGLRYCMNGVALRFKPAPGVKPPEGA